MCSDMMDIFVAPAVRMKPFLLSVQPVGSDTPTPTLRFVWDTKNKTWTGAGDGSAS